jgi:hypothetical protein
LRSTSSIFFHNNLEGSQDPEGRSVRDDHDARAGKYKAEPRTRIDEPYRAWEGGDWRRRMRRTRRIGQSDGEESIIQTHGHADRKREQEEEISVLITSKSGGTKTKKAERDV